MAEDLRRISPTGAIIDMGRGPPFLYFFLTLIIGLCWEVSSEARFYDMYRADYMKTSFCIAQGGACVSDVDPEMSFFQNPAALEAGEEGLVYDGDYQFLPDSQTLEPGQKNANNLQENSFLAGGGYAGKKWGMAVAAYGRFDEIKTQASLIDANGNQTDPFNIKYKSTSVEGRIPVAFRTTKNFSWGFALTFLYRHEVLVIDNAPKSSTENIDKVPYPGLAAGLIWRMNSKLRFGLMAQSATSFYIRQSIDANANGQSINFTEDMGLIYPWTVKTGLSIMPWGEAKKTTFFLDAHMIGNTPSGFQRSYDVFGSAFNDAGLRAKGRDVVLEPHIGFRTPWSQGSKFTIYLGSYYENSRWDGIPGRAHGSAGVAYNFGFAEVIVAADISRDYKDLEFSFR